MLENGRAVVTPLATAPEAERWPEFSPDGRWLAFGSNAAGRDEVYVQPYPGPGPRRVVSLEGGTSPAWSPAGRELFFLSLADAEEKSRMMVADLRPGARLKSPTPRRSFRTIELGLERVRLFSLVLLRTR
jgi:tricorn protease